MITIFNRRELTSTFDIAQQAEIRQMLASHGIDHLVHLVDQSARGGRGHKADTADRQTFLCEYVFYVRRSDYAQAAMLIRQD